MLNALKVFCHCDMCGEEILEDTPYYDIMIGPARSMHRMHIRLCEECIAACEEYAPSSDADMWDDADRRYDEARDDAGEVF